MRLPIRMKITLPYALLAFFVILAAAYVVTQFVTENVEERFTRQLIEVGQLTTDWMVFEEQQRLETLRLVIHTEGFAEELEAGNVEELRQLVLPLAVNAQEEAVEILDVDGVSLLSLYHKTGGNVEEYEAHRGDTLLAESPFVTSILAGRVDDGRDKFAGTTRVERGDYFYVSGPVFDGNGRLLGVVLIGKSLSTLVSQIRQETFAQITFYDSAGTPAASTLPFGAGRNLSEVETAVSTTDHTPLREQTVGSLTYSEILAPWEVRNGTKLGVVGAALPQTPFVQASQNLRLQIFILTAAIFFGVIAVGILLAHRITRPLLHLVHAASGVAEGNLEQQVVSEGKDEVGLLAYSFNNMLHSLREGALYRDLLGRTVTPEVRDELRQQLSTGSLRLEGETKVATALFSDIRQFTTISEEVGADVIFELLNEYLGEVVPAVAEANGLVTDFVGDAFLAFFGLLPRSLAAEEGAYQACQAAVAICQIVNKINKRRLQTGKPVFITGIGINTGEVAAGGIGSVDRVHYTVIGDTVNTSQRLESFTKQFGETSIVISEHTWLALGERRQEFQLESLGRQQFKGKANALGVYRLLPKHSAASRPLNQERTSAGGR